MKLMLDENVSRVVAVQIRLKRSDIVIECVSSWRAGAYLGATDAQLLGALNEEDWLLVTFDTQILAEQSFLFEAEPDLAGILFIDERTIAPHDFGALPRALISFWDTRNTEDWRARIGFLRR